MNINPDGNVYPCCLADWRMSVGNINDNSFEEIYNSEKMKELRRDMLAGKDNSMCYLCYNREDVRQSSIRMWENDRWKHKIDDISITHADGFVPEYLISYFDLMISTECNLKCVMCNDTRSFSWKNDAIAMFGHANNEILSISKHLNHVVELIPNLEELYFSGGEPLLMRDHYMLLEKLIECNRTDIRLRYNTNMTTLQYKGFSIIDMWKQFDSVTLGVSLDGVGKHGEYIRKGLNYNKFIENVKTVQRECPNIVMNIHCAVQILNIFHIPKMHKILSEEGILNTAEIILTPLVEPRFLRYENINKNMHRILKKLYNDYCNSLDESETHMYGLKNDIKCYSPLPYKDEFIEYITKLDKVRNTNYLDVCPELKDL